MKLRQLFGLKSVEEKIETYKELKKYLKEVEDYGQELSEKFMLQKSMAEDINVLSEDKKNEIFKRYSNFCKEHAKEVAVTVNKRNELLKSIQQLRNDEEIAGVCKEIDALENIRKSFIKGNIDRKTYFSIMKSITGEPVKYADVIALNSETGKILILHRVDNFVPTGEVCVPGGHVDEGEDFQTAALRELKEETNLDPIQQFGIIELGEHKDSDAHIKYYQVTVDDKQPITVDASEHCFYEWVDYQDLVIKPFIFSQGEIILKMLLKPRGYDYAKPIITAYKENKVTEDVVAEVIKKAMDTENAEALMPESMDGTGVKADKKAEFIVRDEADCVEKILKAISGTKDVTINEELLDLQDEVCICDVKPLDSTYNNLRKMEVYFVGNSDDLSKILRALKLGLMTGAVKVKTPHEEFMMANEHGNDYVGDVIFFDL